MQTSELNPDLLTRLYHFATLLTGSSEEGGALLMAALQRCNGQMDQFRRESQGRAMLVARLREMAAKSHHAAPAENTGETGSEVALARTFAQIAEPKRSALALLYTGLFPLPEIASLLGLSIDDLCETFSQARTDLDAQWQNRTGHSSPALSAENAPEMEAGQP